MKKFTLLVASMFLVGSMANASENPVFSDNNGNGPRYGIDYRNAEPIMFMERGIAFYIFPNGEFDFNTQPTETGVYTRTRRGGVNATYSAPATRGNVRGYYTPNYGVRIEHDNFGRVKRVGNVFINYDSANRVKRVGTVYMSYNSFALSQVGGLRIFYNRRGQIIDISGFVNNASQNYTYAPYSNGGYPVYDNDDYDDNNYGSGTGSNDDDYYYYKADGTKAKMSNEDIKTIKDSKK